MQVSQEIQARIIEVAEQLHAENSDKFPTVAEVRALSKADMNSVSIVMKNWRQSKLMPVQKIEETAPAEILELSNQLASKIWGEAKLQAESKLRDAEQKFNDERKELEELRLELANECDRLNTELEQITELKDDAVKAQNDAETALNEALQQIEQLKSELQQSQQSKLVEIAKNKELEQHISTLKSQLNERDADLKALKSEHSQQLEQRNEELNTLKSEHLNEIKHIQQKHEDQLKTLQTSESSVKERLIHLEKELAVCLSKIEQSDKYANELKELLAKNLSANLQKQKNLENNA
ncbi:DNA-binding protein [Acinetobacter sp. AL9]|uniref:DNA-binding protein n=1 Tax=Acinetobacter sp. AL9 TaxID=3273234 RepID=UPI0035560704